MKINVFPANLIKYYIMEHALLIVQMDMLEIIQNALK
jgi:hypothetical protein